MRRALLILFAVSLACDAVAVEREIDMKLGCKANPQVVGACYSVRGRMSAYNGTPGLRIWPVGTHRLLGILPDEEPASVPENIRELVGVDKHIYGHFLVCPFTKSKPGTMQYVCIEAVSDVHVESRR